MAAAPTVSVVIALLSALLVPTAVEYFARM
jgi:hypothetical protein